MQLRGRFLDSDEDPLVRQQAGRQGWTVDGDGWFRRLRNPADPPIGHLGFMTDSEVYVGSCGYALQYDEIARGTK